MKKTMGYPALAVALGAVLCALRRVQLRADFDELRLPVPGAATHWLIGLTAVTLVGFALLMLPLQRGQDWDAALGEEKLLPLRLGAVCYALATAALILGYRSALEEDMVFQVLALVVPVMMVLTAVPAAVGLWLAAGGGADRGRYLVLPTLFGCFWTLDACRSHAADPVELHFAWLLLAVICSGLTWYELTALALGRGHARRCFYLSLVSAALSMAALVGEGQPANLLLLLGQTVCLLTVSVGMAKRMK